MSEYSDKMLDVAGQLSQAADRAASSAAKAVRLEETLTLLNAVDLTDPRSCPLPTLRLLLPPLMDDTQPLVVELSLNDVCAEMMPAVIAVVAYMRDAVNHEFVCSMDAVRDVTQAYGSPNDGNNSEATQPTALHPSDYSDADSAGGP